MFKEWDFLLAEIWVLIALAALIGLLAGWLIWGGRSDVANHGPDADEVRRLRAELERAKTQGRARIGDPLDDVPDMPAGGYSRPAQPAAAPAAKPVPSTTPPETKPVMMPRAAPSKTEVTTPSTSAKPEPLSEPRDGMPDDLTKIKGIGAKMEQLCNRLGFFHYDQIAHWTAQEIAWLDDNLEGFKGRVTRDGWVDQAKALAKNQTPAFVRRKD